MSLDLLDATKNPAVNSLKADKDNVKADQAAAKLADDFDEFMLLLTTQLQNQDPSQPLDTNEFTAQLVQFTSVEQAVATNQNLEKLLALSQSNQVNTAVSFIGTAVETEGNQLALSNGQARFALDVPYGAASVTVGILDASGKAVFSDTSKPPSGHQTFYWDGRNSFGGAKAKDGVYTFGVVARDSNGKVMESKTYTTGKVAAVELDGEEMLLTLEGGLDVPMSKVKTVREVVTVNNTSSNTQQQTTTTGNTNNSNNSNTNNQTNTTGG